LFSFSFDRERQFMTQDVDKITSFEVTSRYTPGHLLAPFGWAADALAAMVEAEPTLLFHLFELDSTRMHLIALAIAHLNKVSPAIGPLAPCPLSGFPAPEGFEARAMPPKDCLRLNHLGQIEQARPDPRHPYEQCPVDPAQRRRTLQGDAELVTEKQVLGFKPPPRLEQVGDEHSERVQNRIMR
jgi:hypothetical protein